MYRRLAKLPSMVSTRTAGSVKCMSSLKGALYDKTACPSRSGVGEAGGGGALTCTITPNLLLLRRTGTSQTRFTRAHRPGVSLRLLPVGTVVCCWRSCVQALLLNQSTVARGKTVCTTFHFIREVVSRASGYFTVLSRHSPEGYCCLALMVYGKVHVL